MLHTLYAIIDCSSRHKLLYWGRYGWTDELGLAHTFLTMGEAEGMVVDDELIDTRIEPVELD